MTQLIRRSCSTRRHDGQSPNVKPWRCSIATRGKDENVCCRQVPAVRGLMNGLGSNCITHHTLFPLLCLVGDLLEINRRQLEFYNPTYLEHADRNSFKASHRKLLQEKLKCSPSRI
ncbi:hypothetical protein HPB52_009144 [Rhipicephalus sanguineus]|uniref:Uncharacterized protein n=1 Tax=Rhipicephalus sanguineus TaxID=34632 RepID=A0A9D4QAQ1_RHISA|nr:hypothetical protein HPB52_009144 [Rhipicephalus sanguineus]